MQHSVIARITAVVLTIILTISLITCGPAYTEVLAEQVNTDTVGEQEPGAELSVVSGNVTRYSEGEEVTTDPEAGDETAEKEDSIGDETEQDAPELKEITAVKKPSTYFVGDTISWDDVTVTAIYSDDSTNGIAKKTDENPDGYTLDGVEEVDNKNAGSYTVTVTYKEKTAEITITIVEPAVLASISAIKEQTVYSPDDTLSWDDLVVKATYSDGKTETIPVMQCKIGACDISTTGEKKVGISYTEGTITAQTEITITVKNVLSKIEAKKTKKTYTVNDVLNLDDLTVTAWYNDNRSSRVLKPEEYTTNAASLKLAPSGTKKLVISYTEDGITKEVTVKITVKVPEVPVKNGVRTANVLDFGANPTDIYTDKDAIQDALDVEATEKVPLIVYFPAGTYYIGGPLYIHSNTTIRMDKNAVIIRNSQLKPGDGRDGVNHNMLKAAHSGKTTNSVGGYDNVENIVIEGGTWDGGDVAKATTDSNLINIGHAENVTIRNTTIKNCYGNHLIEFAGVKNAEVYGCYFTGFRKMSDGVESEAIQLDICYGDWNPAYKADKTVCNNISIYNNVFVDYPVSVGNHHTLNGYHNKNITISMNTITHTKKQGYQGIYLYGCDNSTIEGNTISGFENGIKTYASTGYTVNANTVSNCNFGIVSAGSSTGKITSNTISNTVKDGILAYNSTKITSISKNKLTKVGTGSRDGIRVCDSETSVDAITGNTINTGKRYGVYVHSSAQVAKISGNIISNTKKSGIYVANSKSKVTFKSNKLTSVGSDAIKIANTNHVKQKYTFAPKVKTLSLKTGKLTITADNLKKVQLKFKNKSYSKSTKKKKYTLSFKAYKKKVASAEVLFTDKYKNVVTKKVTIK